jgi:hypothetical protein
MYVRACMYVYAWMYVCVCVCVWMYVCMYVGWEYYDTHGGTFMKYHFRNFY